MTMNQKLELCSLIDDYISRVQDDQEDAHDLFWASIETFKSEVLSHYHELARANKEKSYSKMFKTNMHIIESLLSFSALANPDNVGLFDEGAMELVDGIHTYEEYR